MERHDSRHKRRRTKYLKRDETARDKRGRAGAARCVVCPSNKIIYASRRDAKAYLKRNLHDGDHMDAYRCPHGHGWHVGHLAPVVVSGKKTREQVYGSDTN